MSSAAAAEEEEEEEEIKVKVKGVALRNNFETVSVFQSSNLASKFEFRFSCKHQGYHDFLSNLCLAHSCLAGNSSYQPRSLFRQNLLPTTTTTLSNIVKLKGARATSGSTSASGSPSVATINSVMLSPSVFGLSLGVNTSCVTQLPKIQPQPQPQPNSQQTNNNNNKPTTTKQCQRHAQRACPASYVTSTTTSTVRLVISALFIISQAKYANFASRGRLIYPMNANLLTHDVITNAKLAPQDQSQLSAFEQNLHQTLTNNSNQRSNQDYQDDNAYDNENDNDNDIDIDNENENENENENDDEEYASFGTYVLLDSVPCCEDSLAANESLRQQSTLFFAAPLSFSSSSSSSSFELPTTKPTSSKHRRHLNSSIQAQQFKSHILNQDFVVLESENLQQTQRHFWYLLLLVFPINAALGNLLVIVAIYRENSLKSITNYFIASLAVSDMLVGVFVMPFAVYVLVNETWDLSSGLCDFYVAVDVVCSTASILNLVAISIDRHRAVSQPISYSARTNDTRRAIITIGAVWLISCAVGAPIVFGLNTSPDREPTTCRFYNSTFIFWSSLASFYIPCLVMVGLYWRIFAAIRSRTKKALGAQSQVELPSDSKTPHQHPLSLSNKQLNVDLAPPQAPLASPSPRLTHKIKHLLSWRRKTSTSIVGVEQTATHQQDIPATATTTSTSTSFVPALASAKQLPLGSSVADVKANKHDDINIDKQLVKLKNKPKPTKSSSVPCSASKSLETCNQNTNIARKPHSQSFTKTNYKCSHQKNNQPNNDTQNDASITQHSPPQRHINSQSSAAAEPLRGGDVQTGSGAVTTLTVATNQALDEQNQLHQADKTLSAAPMSQQPLPQPTTADTRHLGAVVANKPANVSPTPTTVTLAKLAKLDKVANNVLVPAQATNKQITQNCNQVATTRRERNAAKRERKATKTLAIVLGIFLVCWTPFFTCNIIDGICIKLKARCSPSMLTFLVTTWLGYINSCVNPIIYTIFNVEFRRAFRKILSFA